MNLTGIIVEYNPLHNGHKYHIEESKKLTNSDGIIAVMSGNFVQRGTPSIIDKWNRTKMALSCGADLVLELPCLYSLSSAEFFSYGAVSLLNSLGVVNNLCFGSELGNVEILTKISSILAKEPSDFKLLLKQELDKGNSYPASRSAALNQYILSNPNKFNNITDASKIINSSNNILGIEYSKSLIKENSNIKPFTITRKGSDYNDENLNMDFSSASAIRKFLMHDGSLEILREHVPFSVYKIIDNLLSNDYRFVYNNSIFPYIKHKHYTNLGNITNLPDVNEGIHNKIFKSITSSTNMDEVIMKSKSKRYTYTRINRILCQYFIGFDNYDTKALRSAPCPYARVLGFNENGAKILKYAKKNTNIPVYTKLPKDIDQVLRLDIMSTNAYSLINNSITFNQDYTTSPIMLNK